MKGLINFSAFSFVLTRLPCKHLRTTMSEPTWAKMATGNAHSEKDSLKAVTGRPETCTVIKGPDLILQAYRSWYCIFTPGKWEGNYFTIPSSKEQWNQSLFFVTRCTKTPPILNARCGTNTADFFFYSPTKHCRFFVFLTPAYTADFWFYIVQKDCRILDFAQPQTLPNFVLYPPQFTAEFYRGSYPP